MNPIAKLNDQFRTRAGMPSFGIPTPPGAMYMTRGVASLPPSAQIEIWAMVRDFAAFDEDENDPWGEHDFGAIDHGGKKLFWKIDYYADATMREGAEDPADPARSFRVLTILFADEW